MFIDSSNEDEVIANNTKDFVDVNVDNTKEEVVRHVDRRTHQQDHAYVCDRFDIETLLRLEYDVETTEYIKVRLTT